MKNNFIDFHSGPEVDIILIKGLLEKVGIYGIVQNDYNSGNMAGFVGGTLDTVRLKVREEDIQKANEILKDFMDSKQ